MINREDMMELTRRMTVSRTSMKRIAGSYMDEEGYIDGTFNTNFLKLKPSEKQTNLNLARAIPFSGTNENLKRYPFSKGKKETAAMYQLLQEIRSSELKNDAMLETFYELVSETYQSDDAYAVYLFYDVYDVPVKAADKERLGESEEVYSYLICAVCPLTGEYTPGEPVWGFLYPMFTDRSSDDTHIGIYQQDKEKPHRELEALLLGQ